MSDLTPEHDSLVSAIVESLDRREARLKEASGSQWGAMKKLIALKDVAVALVFFGSLIGGAFIVFNELKAKPTTDEVKAVIETRIEPVENVAKENAESIKSIEIDTADTKDKVSRIEDVQSYQLEQSAWEGDVLEHLGSKKKGKAPARPPELKTKELELIGR